MTPRCVAAYLEASFRNDARDRVTNAMVSGFVHLSSESQRSLMNMWALQARGEALTEALVDESSGVKSVDKDQIGSWLDTLHPLPARSD